MKTDDLIGMLATGAGPAPRQVVARTLVPVLAVGLAFAVVAAVAAFGLLPRAMWGGTALWGKLAYATALGGACWWLVGRLARPGVAMGMAVYGPLAVFCLIVLVGLAGLPPAGRAAYLLGKSAIRCPWAIVALALPGLLGLLHGLRRLAPTRLGLTGWVAGLLAGSIGAAGYALACDEVSLGFVAIWYSLGIVLCGGLGAVLGGRMLRW